MPGRVKGGEADDRLRLLEVREAIGDWLYRERRLDLKAGREEVRPTSEASTYLGFQVSRAGVSPGPKMKCRLRRRLAAARGEVAADRLTRSLRAYRGLLSSI